MMGGMSIVELVSTAMGSNGFLISSESRKRLHRFSFSASARSRRLDVECVVADVELTSAPFTVSFIHPSDDAIANFDIILRSSARVNESGCSVWGTVVDNFHRVVNHFETLDLVIGDISLAITDITANIHYELTDKDLVVVRPPRIGVSLSPKSSILALPYEILHEAFYALLIDTHTKVPVRLQPFMGAELSDGPPSNDLMWPLLVSGEVVCIPDVPLLGIYETERSAPYDESCIPMSFLNDAAWEW